MSLVSSVLKALILKKLQRLFKLTVLVCFVLGFCAGNVFAHSKEYSSEIDKLFSRLNLNTKELAQVKANSQNKQKAVQELLKYYKARTSVKHPSVEILDEELAEKDIKYANDALRHIFVGQPAYDSHFCGENINWSSSPVPDKEWVWQLNRMYFWNSMAKVYTKSGDEKYAKEWSKQIVHWVKNNPRDKEHKYAWRSIETGIRGRSWIDLFFRFYQSTNFDEETLVYFLNSLFDHAEFLMTQYRSKSNWGLMEAEGMAFIAITFPEFNNAETWKTEAFRRLNNEITLQVYPDGHQRELAIGYHIGCIRWFYRTYEFAKMNGQENAFSQSYLEMIERMCEVPMKIGFPDGTNVQFGDAWQGKSGQHADLFSEWAEMFNRKDFLYLATDGKKGKAPEQTAYALPESGIFSMRSGWNKDVICLVLKCGPDGGGHCQPDNGTFSLYAGGRNLMPDAGSYIYSGNPEWRNWFRQSKIHQTLTLNGENTEYAPKLLKWEPGEKLDILVVENKSYENLTHRRSVFFVDKKYFVIVDDATGSGTGNVDIHFQLAPGGGMVLNHDEYSVRSDFKEGWNVYVKTLKQKQLEVTEQESWVSFEYTKKEPRPAFSFRLKKEQENQPVRFVTVVAPYKKTIPKIEVNVLENKGLNYSELQIRVLENEKENIIGYKLF